MNDGDNGDGASLAVLVARLVEGLLLIARGFSLVLGLPLVIRHAVDDLARLGIGYLDALLARLLAIPARQAVTAEPCQVHQVDVLPVGALPQVRDQAAESGSFQFGAGLVVHGNSPWSEYGLTPTPPQRRHRWLAPAGGPTA